MIKVERTAFEGWKNCVKVSNGVLEAVILADAGPRIISLSIGGGKNLFACIEDTKGKIAGGKAFSGYGGHRLWYAPEIEGRTNAPDNEPAEYEITDTGVRVFSPFETETGISKYMELHMSEGNSIVVRHYVRNESFFPVELAGWAITMFDKTALSVIPQNDYDSGYMSNRSVSLWKYSRMDDERVRWGQKYVTLKHTGKSEPFKFGMSVEKEWAACFVHNCAVVKKFDYDFDGVYANGDCNYESYVCGDFLEIESLTPLVVLDIGEELSFDEEWVVFDNVPAPAPDDEAAIDKVMAKLFE